MIYAICHTAVAPLRAEASDSSEMISQVLFGEKLVIIEQEPKWIKVKLDFDQYEGWMDPKQVICVSEDVYHEKLENKYANQFINHAILNDYPIFLPIGAELRMLKNSVIKIGDKEINYFGTYNCGIKKKERLVEVAKMYLNVPYLWGGKTSFGIDCSGLVQQVYKLIGYNLPRDAYQQAEVGQVLSFIEEAEPGDLAFFENEEGRIVHVGIMYEDHKIIHAHGCVRIDPIDANGIFNIDSQTYSHKLRFLRKII